MINCFCDKKDESSDQNNIKSIFGKTYSTGKNCNKAY